MGESEAEEVVVTNMSPDKLQESQQTDPTLDKTGKLAETETVKMNGNAKFAV